MRISDEERSRSVEELRRHCSAGRLAVDDYATRVAEALSAETLAELDHALRDLPRVRIADPRPDPPLFAPSSARAGDLPGRRGPRAWQARLVLLVSVAVVVAGVVFVVLAQWVWAVILVLAWLGGLAQGRVPGRRRRRD